MSSALTTSLSARAAQASAYLLGGVFYSRIANMLMTVVLARLLVPEDFGLVALGTTLLLMVTQISDLSLGSAMIYHRQLDRDDFDTAFTLNFIRSLLLTTIMISAGHVLAASYDDPRLIGICAGLSLRPLLAGLGSSKYVMFAKNIRFGNIAAQESATYTAQLLVSVTVAFFAQSYWAIVAGNVAASLVGLIWSYIAAPYMPRYSLAAWRKMMSYSVWLTLSQVVIVVGNRFEGFLVGGWLGIAVLGAYSVGNNLASMVTQSAIQPIQRVLFPSFARISDDTARLRLAFQRSQSALFAFGLAVGIGTALVAEPAIYLLLGPGWDVAVLVLQAISPMLGLQIVFGPVNALANSMGKTRLMFTRGLFLVAIRVPAVLIGLFYFGLPGVLFARVVFGGIITSIVNLYIVDQLIGASPLDQLRVTWRSWISGAAMAVVCLLIRYQLGPVGNYADSALMLALQVALGALTYCGVHALLWLTTGRTSVGIEAEAVKMAIRMHAAVQRRLGRVA